MKFSKKITSIVFLFASFVVMLFLSCQNVKAQFYDPSVNKIIEDSIFVSREQNTLKVSIQYQNGVKDIEVYICETSAKANCISRPLTKFVDLVDDNPLDDDTSGIFNTGDGIAIYDGTYQNPASGISLNQYSDKIDSDGKVNNKYYLVVRATFCIVRNEDKDTCAYWDVYESGSQQNQGKYSSNVLQFEMESGYTSSAELNTTIGKLLNIVNNVVIPVLWVGLGILLVVRGILLGMAIVKSADEPEVRKSKITGLIWLFIGVGVGYAVSIGASAIMSSLGYGGIFS